MPLRTNTSWFGVVLDCADAELAGFQPQETVRVMLDPAGHPFCLYVDSGGA